MSWSPSPTTPNLHQRPLNDTEKGMIFWITSERPVPREPIKIHCFAEFSGPNLSSPSSSSDATTTKAAILQAFKDAWKALRLLKDPDIATSFADGYKRYKVPSSTEELEEWVSETFRVAKAGASVQGVVREMQGRLDWLPVCYLVPEQEPMEEGRGFKGTLILFISHWRTEASGAFKVVNQLFDYATDLLSGTATREALEKHTPGSEVQFLAPVIEEVLMPDRQTTPEAKARVEKHFDDYYAKLPSIDFPMQGGDFSSPPSCVKLNLRTYTPAATSSLVSACRAKGGITVTSALHSAYLGIVWGMAKPSKRTRSYACLMPAQVRTRLPASSPLRAQGCWNAAQMLMLTAPAGQDFITRAKGLRQQYGLASQPTWLYEDTREVSEQMTLTATKTPGGEPYSLPWITSIGLLDGEFIFSEHGNIKIDNVAVWADSVGPGIVFGLWTFRGRLNLQVMWNVSYHADEQIQELMDGIDTSLEQELGVKMDIERAKITEY